MRNGLMSGFDLTTITVELDFIYNVFVMSVVSDSTSRLINTMFRTKKNDIELVQYRFQSTNYSNIIDT